MYALWSSLRWHPLYVLSAAAALWLAGCAGKPKLLPVSGIVTNGGTAAKTGSVQLWPDDSRGNTAVLEAIGDIKSDGSYSVTTRGQPGVAPGAYKVLVFSSAPTNPKDPYSETKSIINTKYNTKQSSPLELTVVSDPAP